MWQKEERVKHCRWEMKKRGKEKEEKKRTHAALKCEHIYIVYYVYFSCKYMYTKSI